MECQTASIWCKPCVPPRAIPNEGQLEGADDLLGGVLDDWAGSPRNTAPEEHDDFGWFTADELPAHMMPDPRPSQTWSDMPHSST